jgi:hypothetical protein
VNCDHRIEQDDDNEDQHHPQSKIVEKHGSSISASPAEPFDRYRC